MRKREKRERRKKERAIVDFIMVMNHFFHYLREWLLEMDDPRNKSYITYTQADLFYMGLLKSVCGQHTMRGMKTYFGKVFVSLKGLADGGVFQGLPGNFSNSS